MNKTWPISCSRLPRYCLLIFGGGYEVYYKDCANVKKNERLCT